MVWDELSAIFGEVVKMEKAIRCLWMGMLLCFLFCDFDILTGHVVAYPNNYSRLIKIPSSNIYDSSADSNVTNNLDAMTSVPIRTSYSDTIAEKMPVISSITVSPNPSTKGDKVILNIAVAYKNLSELMYSWSEMGNLVVSLNGADTPTPSFIAPHVRADTNVTFCVTVTNELGQTSSGNTTATINASNEAAKITSIAIHGMP